MNEIETKKWSCVWVTGYGLKHRKETYVSLLKEANLFRDVRLQTMAGRRLGYS